MNTKRLLIILIALAFSFVTLFSIFALFSIKEVEIEFAVADDADVSKIEQTLEGYVGKSLLFVKAEDIEEDLKQYHYMEVSCIEKCYPNILKLKVEQRRETYFLEHDENVYVTTEDGFVLEIIDKNNWTGNTQRDKITLKIKKIDLGEENPTEKDVVLEGATVASTISMTNDDFLSTVFDLAKRVNLTDCIKEIKVEKIVNGTVVNAKDIVITTYTGVTVRIMDADKQGATKIDEAFKSYDNAPTDYIKTFDYILVRANDAGEIVVDWSSLDNTPS